MSRKDTSIDKIPTTTQRNPALSSKPISIWIHAQPRAGKSEVICKHGDAVKVRLKAPPVDGKANEELVRMLAKAIGIPKAAIQITHGETGRRKRVTLEGVTEAEVLAALGL